MESKKKKPKQVLLEDIPENDIEVLGEAFLARKKPGRKHKNENHKNELMKKNEDDSII